MAIPDASAIFAPLVDIDAPMDDILATLPYVIPLSIFGLMLLFYQRHLPRANLKRNLLVFICIASLVASGLMLIYAAFGSRWWGPTDLPFGSWAAFVVALQGLTDVIFGSVLGSLLYTLIVLGLFALLIHYAISPPEPDVVSLREELRMSRDESKGMHERIQKTEAENKRLNEFLSEKESALAGLEGELEAIKAEIGEREASIALMEEELGSKITAAPPKAHGDIAQQLAAKDEMIESLKREVESLRSSSGVGVRAQELEANLGTIEAKWEDLVRRAETATEVSDGVISDLVDLISQVEASKKDDSVKRALVTLIEALGRSMTRISRESGDTGDGEPPFQVIGAIIMVNEAVDVIKKYLRS